MSLEAEPLMTQLLELAENDFITTVSMLKNMEEKVNKMDEKIEEFS